MYGNWFHYHCLRACGVKRPKKTNDFVCEIPPTIPWRHEKYTNTCTADNFLAVLLAHCHQHSNFLEKMGSSAAEVALKAGLAMMLQGNVYKGKQ